MPSKTIPLIFYAILFCLVTGSIVWTAYEYPLFPFQTDDLDWSVAWLWSTVVDFYGSTLCFAGVVLSSEGSWVAGIVWTLAFCLLGSPACCLWACLRLHRFGSLRLETPDKAGGENQDAIAPDS